MHQLQRHILSRLINLGSCRYRDLKPKEVDGNLFTYHLKQLLEAQLVERSANTYKLSASGLRYVDRLSLSDLKERIQPKIVSLIAVRNRRGDWLLYKRGRQPFKGMVGFPYGKTHLGETVLEAAKRELWEKTGLEADLTHRGDAYVTVTRDEELVSVMLAHVFAGKNPRGSLKTNSSIGNCFWAKIVKPDAKVFFPGFADIFQLLAKKTKGRFFTELFYQL